MSDVELHKHKCAVRHLCALRKKIGLQQFRVYIKTVELSKQVISDFLEQWEKGNRGTYGDWR